MSGLNRASLHRLQELRTPLFLMVGIGFQADSTERPEAPLVVIRTQTLSEAREAVERAGGVIATDAFSFPGGKRFHFREPGGCELAVWCPDEASHS